MIASAVVYPFFLGLEDQEAISVSDIRVRLRSGAVTGAFASAMTLKRRFRDLSRLDFGDDTSVQNLLSLFFVEQDSARIELLMARVSPGVRWRIRFDEALGHHPLVCSWTSTRHEIGFTFGRFLFTRHCDDSIRRWRGMLALFERVAAAGGFLGSVDLNLSDLGITPGACFCDNRDAFVLIPDMSFVESGGYESVRRRFASPVPWAERSSTAFWRGSTTGHPPVSNLAENPRAALCLLARDKPEADLDVGLSQIVQFSPEWTRAAHEAGLVKPFEPWQMLDRHRYHIDIDGNTNSWPGLLSKLHCGGVVLKVDSAHGYKQWYYHRLLPWVHFVPIRSDLADLIETLHFLRRNDGLAERIARQGRGLAASMTLDAELDRGVEALFAYSIMRARSR